MESIGDGAKNNGITPRRNSLPIWGPETIALPVSGPLFDSPKPEVPPIQGNRGKGLERGCTKMTRFARVLAVLSALASVFMVAGASTKY